MLSDSGERRISCQLTIGQQKGKVDITADVPLVYSPVRVRLGREIQEEHPCLEWLPIKVGGPAV